MIRDQGSLEKDIRTPRTIERIIREPLRTIEDNGNRGLFKIQNNDLNKIVRLMSKVLNINENDINDIINKYKDFKKREGYDILPVHPWVIEAARILPHFILLGLGIIHLVNNS